MLLLAGGMRISEATFIFIQAFELDYRIIVPSYPPIQTVEAMTGRLIAILNADKVQDECILGESYGGCIGQLLLRRLPLDQSPPRQDKAVGYLSLLHTDAYWR